MAYSLTKDLETGNALIDSEHRQLFAAVNDLMDACSSGRGREKVKATAAFLNNYVAKHFNDEEQLQMRTKYPDYAKHKQFHEGYKQKLFTAVNSVATSGATIATIGELNQVIGILISHIRSEDKKLAAYLKNNG